jgi:hypothetical protein
MENSNKHLDDLFAAARSEEPIISEENTRDLLARRQPMQLPSTLITTKGAIMTSIALSVATITAYVLLSGSPAPQPLATTAQPQIAMLATRSATTTDEPKKTDPKASRKIVVEKSENDESLPTPPTPPQPPSLIPAPPVPPVPPLRVMPPLKVTGIHLVMITPEQSAKMGITKKDNGTVSFSQKNDKGTIFTMSFPEKSWGIIIDDEHAKVAKEDVPTFAPLIVTDTKGNKRLMQFTGESNGVKMKSMQINTHSDGGGNRNTINIENKIQIGGEDGNLDKLQIGQDADNEGSNEIELQAQSGVSSGNENEPAPEHQHVKVIIKNQRHETDTTIGGKPHKMIIVKKIVQKDSTLHSLNKGLKMDSVILQSRKSLKIAEQQLKMINMDSIYQSASEVMKKAEEEIKKINLDSILNEATKSLKNAGEELKRMNIDSIMKSANQSMIEAEEIMAKRCDELNSLVPILVRSATRDHYDKEEDITYDDGLIFWYDNSRDLANAVHTIPARYEPGSVAFTINGPATEEKPPTSTVNQGSMIMTKTLLYPNPARNSTTVRLALSEPRMIAFTIHDLLGKRVMEAGNLAATSAGNYEKELNLSELTPGVYLLVITTDKGEQSMQRLVIEK